MTSMTSRRRCRCNIGWQRKVTVPGHLLELLSGRLCPLLPLGQTDGTAVNVNIRRRKGIAAVRRNERPVGPYVVVTTTKLFQGLPRFTGAGIQLPVDLFGLERLVKSLEEPQLRRRPILDAHMRVLAVDVLAKRSREKARAVVGDEKR